MTDETVLCIIEHDRNYLTLQAYVELVAIHTLTVLPFNGDSSTVSCCGKNESNYRSMPTLCLQVCP
jgi:hypothetical protein